MISRSSEPSHHLNLHLPRTHSGLRRVCFIRWGEERTVRPWKKRWSDGGKTRCTWSGASGKEQEKAPEIDTKSLSPSNDSAFFVGWWKDVFSHCKQYIRIPCTNTWGYHAPNLQGQCPSKILEGFVPGFQITAGIWSLTVVLVKTGNHQQLLLQALILSQGLAKMFPSMTSVLQISCLVANKTFKCKERKCGPLVHDVTKRWKNTKLTGKLSAMESKNTIKAAPNSQPPKFFLRRCCGETVPGRQCLVTVDTLKPTGWSPFSPALKEAVVSSLVRRFNALSQQYINQWLFLVPLKGGR